MILKMFLLVAVLLTNAVWPQELTAESLQPAFTKEMVWPLTVTASSVWGNEVTAEKQSFHFKMRLKISEWQDQVPVRVEYLDVNGPQVLSRISGGVEKETERMENHDGTIVGQVDANFLLYSAKDIGHLSNDILLIFPPGPCFGFISPAKTVQVGESWSSGDVVPVGPRTIKKGQFKFSGVNGQFKLEEVKGAIANISWNGIADVTFKSRTTTVQGKAEWQRQIVFDLRTRKFKGNDGVLCIKLLNGLQISHNVSIKVNH